MVRMFGDLLVGWTVLSGEEERVTWREVIAREIATNQFRK
jgi:hypothetical protein